MKIEKITDQIIHVIMPTQRELAEMFLRFQEHYESPNNDFRNNIFTLGQYRQWYSKENGAFTYYEDWNGFNIPSRVFEPFTKGLFDPLTPAETKLVEAFGSRTDKFYVIGTHKEDETQAMEHEICHGLFYLKDDYRKQVLKELAKHITYDHQLIKWLGNNGYTSEVFYDECNAYIVADREWLKDEHSIEVPNELHSALVLLKKKVSE